MNVAVSDCKLLVGADVSVVLRAVDGTAAVAVSVVAQLLCDVLDVSTIFTSFSRKTVLMIYYFQLVINVLARLVVLVNYDLTILGAVLSTLGSCLCELIAADRKSVV